MRIFITGINGFIGGYLVEHLIKNYPRAKIYGMVHQSNKLERLCCIKNRINLLSGDILDSQRLMTIIKLIKPNWIFHLAAKISPRYVKEVSEQMLETNIIGTLHLLKAVKDYAPLARVLIASSAAVYGNALSSQLPIRETYPVASVDAYGSSKACSEIISQQYFKTFNLKIIITRTFNLLAPARAHTFIEAGILPQIKSIKKEGAKPVIRVGDLNTWRDFLDVRDAVQAYVALMEKGRPGEIYNICSGKMIKMQKILSELLLKVNLKNKIKIVRDPKLIRPIDIKKSLGSNHKIIQETGWHPKISISQTLLELLKNENLSSR